MKLFYSPFHNFIHKVLVTIHECGQWDNVEFVGTYPFKRKDGSDGGAGYSLIALNPLNKVPTLATDDGMVLYGSQAIVEYIDSLAPGGRKLYPEPGPARWDAVRRLGLADQTFEITVMVIQEGWQPLEKRRIEYYRMMWPKIIAACDVMEEDAKGFGDNFDIGHVAMLHCLSYLDFVNLFYESDDPLYPNYNWRKGRPTLEKWYEEAVKRPSVQAFYMKEYQGDDSPENCQRAIREVLVAQGKAEPLPEGD